MSAKSYFFRPAFLLIVLFGFSVAQAQTTISVQVNASSDDAEEQGANGSSPGSMDLTSSDLELVRDGNDGDQWVGMRFANVAVPQNAIITNAYIQFTVDEDDTLTGDKFIYAEDVDNASTFTSVNFNISSRPRIADSVTWSNIPTWPVVGAAGTDQQTPDISTLIQSMVNRGGWASGNALNLLLHGTGERVAESYDGSSAAAPELIVEFYIPVQVISQVNASSDDAEEQGANGSSPGTMDLSSSDLELVRDGNDGDQWVGMRFTGIAIPQGATIGNAYIQYTVDEDDTLTGDKYYYAEDVDNATTFTSGGFNISSRPRLADSVLWTNIPVWPVVGAAGADQQSPDLTSLVQGIVNRPGWASGNALNILVNGTGERVAESYDGSAVAAPQLIINYISSVFVPGGFPITMGSQWKFDDTGIDLGTAWSATNFNDSLWDFGPAILGYNNGNEATVLDFGPNSNSKYPTYYLRHTFITPDLSLYDSLEFDVLRDDGVVVYVNGTEAFRMNMPTGPVTYNSAATAVVGGADESTYFKMVIPNTLVNNDTNVIAVELHQQAVTSSDLSFDLTMKGKRGPIPLDTFPIVDQSNWLFLDDGSDLDSIAWKDTAYNDNTWDWGPAPLGYNDLVINTVVDFGTDPNNKYITTWFRKPFYVNDTSLLADSLLVKLMRDDAGIVYINGTEVVRSNLPVAPTNYLTFSSSIVSGAAETAFNFFLIDRTVLHNGINEIAVEVHQRDGFSSDKIFDLELDEAPNLPVPGQGCPSGITNHIGCFTSIQATAQTTNMVIPDSHRFQLIFKQGENYTKGGGTVPGNNDFTGYVGKNGSSTEGWVSVNHENTPGGVSIVDLHYNANDLLWEVDTTQAIDFFNNDLVTTTRNCSGGITPWGTIVTSEETTNAGDINNDGYQDVGWNVEIDPVTKKVREYGNGIQEKLWAMGRIAHENIVVSTDNVTAYYGEDGGSSCLFKFVADNPMDLSSGTLYVLDLDSSLSGGDPLGTTGQWVMVPNTTQNDRNNLRSLATSLGGTNFSGVEDAEINPITGQIYFTSKGNGRVYRFTDGATSVSGFETYVGGTSYAMHTSQGLQFEPWGGGNDNLTFDDLGNLWVLQDGGRNYIWLVRPDHTVASPRVELFLSAPSGSEPTGMTFSPDHKFMFVSMQHPSGSNTPQMDATGNMVNINASSTVVIARKEFLGPQAPIAAFEGTPTTVNEGDQVSFTDTSDFTPTSWSWSFPGGTPATSTVANPQITYNTAGTYDVTLTATNAEGNDAVTKVDYITVNTIPTPPVADFTGTPTTVTEGNAVNFSDNSTNTPTSWSWTFTGGSPASSTSSSPSVTYTTPGTYDVTLTVTNSDGNDTETKSNYITVQADTTIGIAGIDATDGVKVFPNPFTGSLNLELKLTKSSEVTVALYTVAGVLIKTLQEGPANAGTFQQQFEIEGLLNASQPVILVVDIDGKRSQQVLQYVR